MSKDMRLAIVAFPLAFLPGLLTALFRDVVIKPSAWWGFHLIYALSCFTAIGVLWLILKSNALRLKDIGLQDFRWNHVAWAFLFFVIAGTVWYGVSSLLGSLGLTSDWGSEIRFTQPYQSVEEEPVPRHDYACHQQPVRVRHPGATGFLLAVAARGEQLRKWKSQSPSWSSGISGT